MIEKIEVSNKDLDTIVELAGSKDAFTYDLADYTNTVVKKPWGFEYLIYNNNDVAVWILNMKGGGITSMHCHPNKKTSLIVLSGEARFSTLEKISVVPVGHGVLMDKGIFHETAALSPNGIVVMETETPTNKKDLIRLGDRYGRIGKGYEGEDAFEAHDGSLPHFNERGDRYECRKNFGDCCLSIIRHENSDSLYSSQEGADGDVATILGGSLMNERENVQYTVGDTFNMGKIVRNKNFQTKDYLELLLIKKII